MSSSKFAGAGGQYALSAGVLVLGLFFLVGSGYIPDAAGYSTVGPKQVPRVVGIVLTLLSVMLFWEVFRGGFRNHDEAAEQALRFDWNAFVRLTVGIIGYGLLIERAGFIFASVFLFLATAYAFYSKRWLLNTVVAVILAVGIFALFNYGLGLSLPAGILSGVL